MSKKKAQSLSLRLLRPNRNYVQLEFTDHKDRRLMSSVDVVVNLDYYPTWEEDLQGFLITR